MIYCDLLGVMICCDLLGVIMICCDLLGVIVYCDLLGIIVICCSLLGDIVICCGLGGYRPNFGVRFGRLLLVINCISPRLCLRFIKGERLRCRIRWKR